MNRVSLLWVAALFVTVSAGCRDVVPEVPSDADWESIIANDVATVPSGWSTPTRLAVNSENWEDGVYISRDGSKLYFTYYPGIDLLADVNTGEIAGDLDVYVSEVNSDGDFETKTLFTQNYLSEDIWSEGGVMVDQSENLFYHSNRDYMNDEKADDDIYRGDVLLAFNDDRWFGNPHYCEALDELYFDERDQKIYVLKDAAAGGFAGVPELAQAPINAEGSSFQPFLTPDGQTLYLSANRGDIPGGVAGPGIYRSLRTGGTWSEPELMIHGKVGVGEGTLTEDGQKLFFVQLFHHAASGAYTSELFMTQKTE